MRVKRSAALRAVAVVTAFLVGCSSTSDRAMRRHALITPGMSKKEVRTKLGNPAMVRQLQLAPEAPDGVVEEWSYQYTEGVGVAEVFTTILVTAVVVALVVVVVAAAAGGRGGGGGWNFGGLGGGGGGGGDGGTYTFSMTFDQHGCVKAIGPIVRTK